MTLTFKQYLNEAHLLDSNLPEELRSNYSARLFLDENGRLECNTHFRIDDANKKYFIVENGGVCVLKYPFGRINGDFHVSSLRLTSFEDFPTEINGSLYAYINRLNNDFTGFPAKVKDTIDLEGNRRITTFSGLYKHLKECNGKFWIPGDVTGGMLGLLKIKGLQHVGISGNEITEEEVPELAKACEIITRHLQGDRNIMDCQEELMDNGLEDYAQL